VNSLWVGRKDKPTKDKPPPPPTPTVAEITEGIKPMNKIKLCEGGWHVSQRGVTPRGDSIEWEEDYVEVVCSPKKADEACVLKQMVLIHQRENCHGPYWFIEQKLVARWIWHAGALGIVRGPLCRGPPRWRLRGQGGHGSRTSGMLAWSLIEDQADLWKETSQWEIWTSWLHDDNC